MRIGLVTPSWPGGDRANGIATAVAHLATGLLETGHKVTIIPLRTTKVNDPTVVNLPPARNWTLFERINRRFGRDIASGPILIERLVHAAQAAVARDGIEVLIIEETQGWASALQKALDIPVIATLHGPWFLVGPLAHSGPERAIDQGREVREGAALAACAGFTAPSRYVLDKTQTRYGLKSQPSAVILNPMPTGGAIDHQAMVREFQRNILFIGRFDYLKGGDVLLEAFRQLITQGTEARLTIAGPDPGLVHPDGSRQSVAEAIAELPEAVQIRIDYKGPLSKTEVAALRGRHAIAVVASRFENLSYVMLESLAAGAATICTAVGGHAETIRHGETGLLIPPGDPVAMAQALRQLVEDPQLTARLGAAAHRQIANDFAPTQIAKELTTFLMQKILK